MIVASLDHWRRYCARPLWERAFGFLAHAAADITDGRHVILGDDLYANVATYEPRALDGARYEAHECYIDIQYVLAGGEWMHVASRAPLVPAGPYDAAGDVRFYAQGDEAYARVPLLPGTFAVLYPEDAHMPGLQGPYQGTVRKIVVKVRMAALPPFRHADSSS